MELFILFLTGLFKKELFLTWKLHLLKTELFEIELFRHLTVCTKLYLYLTELFE